MAKKERLDTLLVSLGHFGSREQAQRAILAGLVRVGGVSVTKAGTGVDPAQPIEVAAPASQYVSRGGHKLERAVSAFGLRLGDRVAMDVGASTGGFTDVLLKGGARFVYAIDVGYGQLAWSLRQDARVKVMERTNVRHLEALAGETPDLAVIDVSFIGLAKVLPSVGRLLSPAGEVVALVKPQFEAGRQSVGKGGVVRDARVHERVLAEVDAAAREVGFHLWGLTHSPIKGPEGNIEFLAYWRRQPAPHDVPSYAAVVEAAHRELA